MKTKMTIAVLAVAAFLVTSVALAEHMNPDEMRADVVVIRQAAAELKATNADLSNKLEGIADKKDKMIAKWAEKMEAQSASPSSPEAAKYVCPMHPDVQSDKPGQCPKCGMDLKSQAASGTHDHSTHQH